MKKDIHPEWKEATVICNGCNTKFTTGSTTDKITVEICSNCHPFYTGKQKLVDVAGRVDKFKARQAAAEKSRSTRASKAKADKPEVNKTAKPDSKEKLQTLKQSLEKTSAKP